MLKFASKPENLRKNRVPKINPCGDQFWDLFLMDFHLKIVGLRKAAKAIIYYKKHDVSVFIVFKMEIASSPLGGPV